MVSRSEVAGKDGAAQDNVTAGVVRHQHTSAANEPLSSRVRLLKALVPELDDVVADMESNAGWLTLADEFVEVLISFDIHWWEYYENETLVRALGSLALFEPEYLKDIKEQGTTDDLLTELAEGLEEEGIDFGPPTEAERMEWAREVEAASEEERRDLLKKTAHFIIGFLTTTYNYLSLMVHGRTLCRLVQDAKDGDDEAFVLAAHIDRTVLQLPYFRTRLVRAQFAGEQVFLERLAYRLKTPVLSGRIRYRTLWLTFAVLDDEGLLDQLSHEQIMTVCEETGVYGSRYGIEDVGHLSKRLREYRKAQGKRKII